MVINHDNCLVNFSNSLLKAFGVETFHSTIKEFDEVFKNHKKIVVLLFDGMGKNITRKHLKSTSFIRQNFFKTIYSTTPPTTAAATTALLTAKFPIETGWIGWSLYFPEYNRNIVLFKGTDYNTEENIKPENPRSIALEKFPTKTIFDLISSNNETNVFDLKKYPICSDGPKSLRHGRKQLYTILRNHENAFVYFYWDNPDYTMHAKGIDSIKSHYAVKRVNAFVKKVVRDNPDTLFVTLADHGHINTKYIDLSKDIEIMNMFERPACLEKRCASFFVKENIKDKFIKHFNDKYSLYFDLFTKEEALKLKLFGEGEAAPGVVESIGNFIALSKGEYAILCSSDFKNPEFFKGHHAGGTIEEMEIDVSVYNK